MHTEVFRRTIAIMRERGVHLRDLDIFKSEFADTISNYFLYLTLSDLLLEDEDFDLRSFTSKYQIPYDAIIFLRDNSHKISPAIMAVEKLKKIKLASEKEFQLLQKCFIVFLGKDIEFTEVMNMREIFGIRRNLKKKNKSIMIPNLYRMLNEI